MITVAMHHFAGLHAPSGRPKLIVSAGVFNQAKNEAIRYRYVSNDCDMDEEQCEVKNSGIGIFTNAAAVFLERFKCGNNYIFCSIVAETGSA